MKYIADTLQINSHGVISEIVNPGPQERPPESEIDIAKAFLTGRTERRKHVSRYLPSSYIRDQIERSARCHISNGSVIVAAAEIGYRVVRRGEYSLDACFNIKLRRDEERLAPWTCGVCHPPAPGSMAPPPEARAC